MRRGIDPAVLVALFALGAVLYWPMFGIRPLENDNLYTLGWLDAAPVGALLVGDPEIYPEWRPLLNLHLWFEHRAVPLQLFAAHYVVNLASWTVCAWLVFRIVIELSGSRLAGLVSAVLVLTDPRATWALVMVVERQTTMACVFGLIAVLIVVRAGPQGLSRRQALSVGGLLLASALSKEYGLAFALALSMFALAGRRADLGWPAAAAFGIYGALRLALAGGAVRPYCEEMYFFFELTDHCIDPLQPSSLAQMAYNVAAATTDLVVHGLVSEEGRPVWARQRLLTAGFVIVAMALAMARGSAKVRMIALVIVANGLLGFMIFRERNQLVGVCAVGVVAGVGLAIVCERLRGWRAPVAAAVMILLLASQASLARRLVAEASADLNRTEPCRWHLRDRPFAQPFITRVKTAYGMDDPLCRNEY